MKRDGFTLIELLAVIVIVAVLTVVVFPSMYRSVRKIKENSYSLLVHSFEEDARLYTSRHQQEIEDSLDFYNYFVLTLNDLKYDGILSTPIKDPRTNDVIDLNKKIIITRETAKAYDICFEDDNCYVPILLVNELTKEGNIVTGSIDGLHYNENNDTYYFMGNDPKNWVSFGGYLWRVVKINSDRTVKLIFEGTENEMGTTENGTIGNYQFDSASTNNYYNATVRNILNIWYDNHITLDKDRAKVEKASWFIGQVPYDINGTPKSTFYSNEYMTKTGITDIGLLQASDYLYASTDTNCLTAFKTTDDGGIACKNGNYLYKENYDYWTLTGDTDGRVWNITSSGSLGMPISTDNLSNVRPVLNLVAGVIVDKGIGTIKSPYILKDIINVDKNKPIINVLGCNPVILTLGTSYNDAGATAIDNVDGDITSRIVTFGSVNMNKAGTYKVTYAVSDASGNKTNATRTISVVPSMPVYDSEKGVNRPQLSSGMTPIKWDSNTKEWVTTTQTDPDWYDYSHAKWANMRTNDGSMWVWLPRYSYNMVAPHTSLPQSINIKFLDNISTTVSAGYTVHPAFTFGTTQLPGIWVAKFEASSREGNGNSLISDNVTNKHVKIVPNVSSWRYNYVSTAFTVSLNMKNDSTYGWCSSNVNYINTHLIKNTEWGAAVYLSHSIYGKNGEVWINPNSNYITGQVGTTPSATFTITTFPYDNQIFGIQGSTTGNIYGIYDMAGGAWEHVAAYLNNGSGSLSTYGSSLVNAASKYKDVYDRSMLDTQLGNYSLTASKKGDAIYETSTLYYLTTSWYADDSFMPFATQPFFARGSYYYLKTAAGMFAFFSTNGSDDGGTASFRPVLLVGENL